MLLKQSVRPQSEWVDRDFSEHQGLRLKFGFPSSKLRVKEYM